MTRRASAPPRLRAGVLSSPSESPKQRFAPQYIRKILVEAPARKITLPKGDFLLISHRII